MYNSRNPGKLPGFRDLYIYTYNSILMLLSLSHLFDICIFLYVSMYIFSTFFSAKCFFCNTYEFIHTDSILTHLYVYIWMYTYRVVLGPSVCIHMDVYLQTYTYKCIHTGVVYIQPHMHTELYIQSYTYRCRAWEPRGVQQMSKRVTGRLGAKNSRIVN